MRSYSFCQYFFYSTVVSIITITGLFFIVGQCKASENAIIDQSKFNSIDGYTFSGQSFIASSTTISGVSLFLSRTDVNQYFTFVLCHLDDINYGMVWSANCDNHSTEVKRIENIHAPTTLATTTEVKIDFVDILENVNIGDHYYFKVATSKTGYSGAWGVNFQSSDVYSQGEMLDASGSDLAFKIWSTDYVPDYVVVNQEGFGLNIVLPDTNNFPYFPLGNGTATPVPYVFKVVYSIPTTDSRLQYYIKIETANNDTMTTNLITNYQTNLNNQICTPLYCMFSLSYNNATRFTTFKILKEGSNTINYVMKIRINDQLSANPSIMDKLFWTNMLYTVFVPKTFQSSIDDISNYFQSKWIFHYINYGQENLTYLKSIISQNTGYDVLEYKMKLKGTNFDLGDVPILTTNSQPFVNFMYAIRPYFVYFLYLNLMIYLVYRIIYFTRKENL